MERRSSVAATTSTSSWRANVGSTFAKLHAAICLISAPFEADHVCSNEAEVPVGFEGGFGPKGLGNSAQALAWVALFLPASPVRAPDNAGAIQIDRTQIQMTISSAPSGLVAFIVTPPRLKPGLRSQGPSGRVPDVPGVPGVICYWLSSRADASNRNIRW